MKFKDLFTTNMTPNWGVIFGISEFHKMVSVYQDAECDKDTSVATHTQRVTDAMHEYLDTMCVDKYGEYYLMMMSAAICHDIGKIVSPKNYRGKKKFNNKMHSIEGERLIRNMFFEEDIHLREKVCYMVLHHMDIFNIVNCDNSIQKLIRLSYGAVTINDMLILNYCDSIACDNLSDTNYTINDRIDYIKHLSNIINVLNKPYHFDNRCQKYNFFYGDMDEKHDKKSKQTIYIMIGRNCLYTDDWIKNTIPNIHIIDDKSTCINCKENIGTTNLSMDNEYAFLNKIKEQVIECCSNKKDFVINHTNITKGYRDELHKLILPYNPRVVYVYIETQQTKTSQTLKRKKLIDFPEPYEYDRIIIQKQYE